MSSVRAAGAAVALAATIGAAGAWAGTVGLAELDLSSVRQGWGTPQRDTSCEGKPLTLGGKVFPHGLGSHANATIHLALDGQVERFRAVVGVDDETGGRGSVQFTIRGDGQALFDSGVMKGKDAPKTVDLELKGVKRLSLVVTDGGDDINFDHADWGDAVFTCAGAAPAVATPPQEPKVVRTPPPPAAPRINGPRVFGVRPGSPFLFRIPCTGDRPMTFAVKELPAGLTVDAASGLITGRLADAATRTLRTTLVAENAHGRAERELRIVVGDTLALTPTMGWNHWYTHYNRITDALVRQAADAMADSGMADAGYAYVSIDDCWMNIARHADASRVGPGRDAQGNILPNKNFPDMKGLTDYIHGKGLRAGLYTSPGPRTCAGFEGAWQHEAQDAKQFADWGFDLLKYDWCSYGNVAQGEGREKLTRPYKLMGDLLKRQGRDIVLNLCQYGMGNVWEWGAEVGGQSWRTGGDLGFELHRIFEVALKNVGLREYNKPGAWNDPDYIQIGCIGNAGGMGLPQPCPLSPNEQYSFMALWCLMASPLFYSGDMRALDEFTLNVLCNPEVIDVNQDPLGQCARLAGKADVQFVLVKDLEDGSKAVGLFNRDEFDGAVSVGWEALGVQGPQKVRDLWRQKDLGTLDGKLEATVGRRGCEVYRLWPAK